MFSIELWAASFCSFQLIQGERQLREQITLEVSNAVHLLEHAKLSLAASREALDLSKKNLGAEQRKHELGSETVFFVLEAQTAVAQAELSALQAEGSGSVRCGCGAARHRQAAGSLSRSDFRFNPVRTVCGCPDRQEVKHEPPRVPRPLTTWACFRYCAMTVNVYILGIWR